MAATLYGAAVALFAHAGCAPESPIRPNLLVVTIDTMRADRLGAYGHAEARTPNIDQVARGGVLFRHAQSQIPITLPSHSSIFTGLYPTRHNVRENGTYELDTSETTLSEILLAEGYATGAFVSSFTLDSRFGLDQGFDVYRDDLSMERSAPEQVPSWQGHERAFVERPAEPVISEVLEWLKEQREHSFFAWVHLNDPHAPYEAPEPFASSFGDPYDAEVAYVDHALGSLFGALREWGLWKDTIVVIGSDHGESLGEHSIQGHGRWLFQPSLHVPLIISYPRALPEGAAVDELVRNIDIMPTLLEMMGLPTPKEVQGVSALPMVDGNAATTRTVSYSETMLPRLRFGSWDVFAYQDERWKYIRRAKSGQILAEVLYDLEQDPGELQDLARRKHAKLRELSSELDRFMQSEASERKRRDNTRELTPDVEEKLRALGYIE